MGGEFVTSLGSAIKYAGNIQQRRMDRDWRVRYQGNFTDRLLQDPGNRWLGSEGTQMMGNGLGDAESFGKRQGNVGCLFCM